jgi:hypothetical protein
VRAAAAVGRIDAFAADQAAVRSAAKCFIFCERLASIMSERRAPPMTGERFTLLAARRGDLIDSAYPVPS